ncbi:MAG TPA: response regulator [Thermoanaerobaculia bacterium]|jgi:CheY-like chemotaxis protein|nr:response regulator [Thermoanaerobaculia bacterium]
MQRKPIILVVDDDAPIIVLMRSILREFGYEARTATSGAAAIEAARAEAPDLVLLDKNMPGMSGGEVIRALRTEVGLQSVPILLLTGDPVAPQEIAELGANGTVQKPFDLQALLEQIRHYAGVL